MSARAAAGGPDHADGNASPAYPGGVRLAILRCGRSGETLFIVPGLEGDPAELTGLVAAFTGPQTVYAVAPLPEDAEGRPVTGMERIAELMVAQIRRVQPSGPYRLAGYSFGGLAALEVAQQLRAAGETVEHLFLIEAVFDERYWPRGIWLRGLVRRTGRQLVRIAQLPPAQAIGELRLRGVRLIQRLSRRRTDTADPLPVDVPAEAVVRGNALAAIGGYRPRFYDGPMTLIASSMDHHFGCDTAQIWAGYADRLIVRRIAGDHLTVMHDTASAAVIANVIDHALALPRDTWPGLRPAPGFARPMIVTTMRWFSAARLTHALIEAGFAVSACRPGGHPVEVLDGLAGDHRLRRLRRLDSLRTAIRRAEPDLLLPDDERALVLLRRLHARTRASDPDLAALIARSLGNVEDVPLIASRTALSNEARALDVLAPHTEVLTTPDALARFAPPVVLKTDGSWGGRGVAVIRDAERLPGAWRALSNPPSVSRAVKRLVVNRDSDTFLAMLRRVRPVVNAQRFVDGREAMVTVACLDGKVIDLVCLEVMRTSAAKGPASVVRVIEHPAMAEAARRLVVRFGLSGFCGLDFILTPDGEAHLLELNPRVTPTCHLLVEGGHRIGRTVALFPPDASLGRDPVVGAAGVLDVPVRAYALIQRGEEMAARQRRPFARLTRRLTERAAAARY